MTLVALMLAATLASPEPRPAESACPAGLDACKTLDGGWHFTAQGKARVDAELTRLSRELAASNAERDFLNRLLLEQPAKPVTELSAPTSVAIAVGFTAGLLAGAVLTYRALR